MSEALVVDFDRRLVFYLVLHCGDIKMPFVAVCSCSKHQEWHHHSSVDLRVATFYEEKYCNVDSKHGGRKRKICLACRGRIELEEKYRKLESADESSVAAHVVSHRISSHLFSPTLESFR